MKASDLDQRIEIYQQEYIYSDSGASKIDYVFKTSCRARVNYTTGDRTVSDDEIFYSVDRTFIVRHYVKIKETDEIRWNDQRWRILSIDRNKDYNDIIIKTTLINT